MSKALLLVDVQNDFCPGGALAVAKGDEVVPVLNRYAALFYERHWPVFASRDWHPRKTAHFKTYGGPWPEHCIQETSGARFHPQLQLPAGTIILSKGTEEDQDSYSAFQGRDLQGVLFWDLLKQRNADEIFIGGLATDYCVKNSVLDALRHGLKTYLLADAVKGVDANPGDSADAIQEMTAAGARLTDLNALVSSLE